MLVTKAKRKLLAELKQLKIRQKCIEKSIKWPVKLNDLEEDELEFIKVVEKLKSQNEKNSKNSANEAKKTALNCFREIHDFIETVSNQDEGFSESKPSDLLKIMADINLKLSENLFVCSKELASLKYQNDKC